MSDNICPRCGGYIPNNDNPGGYVGALSRVDSVTEVCSRCGTDEALQQFTTGGWCSPKDQWPVESDRAVG